MKNVIIKAKTAKTELIPAIDAELHISPLQQSVLTSIPSSVVVPDTQFFLQPRETTENELPFLSIVYKERTNRFQKI
jgi:hypothetical protein